MKLNKYIYIMYYIIAFLTYLDFVLIMFAPNLQIGIVGIGCLLSIILGIISTFLLIKEKYFMRLIINIGILIGIIIIILFGPGV